MKGCDPMKLPQDPVMLLSAVNMKLRDYYDNLDDLCPSEGVEKDDIVRKLRAIGYEYDEKSNQFI